MSTYFKLGALVEGVNTTATAAGITTLTASDKTVQQFTGVLTQSVVLPDATTVPIGRRFDIDNRSTGIVAVSANGGSLIGNVAANYQLTFLSTSNSTAGGAWIIANATGVPGGAGLVSNANELKMLQALASGLNYNDGTIVSKSALVANPEEAGGDYALARTSLPVAKSLGFPFVIGGYLFFTYGTGPSTPVATNYRYDQDNNYWIIKTSDSVSRQQGTGWTDGNLGYACGGFDGTNALATVRNYNPVTDSWAASASLNTARTNVAGWYSGAYGYAATGSLTSGTSSPITEVYTIALNAWVTRLSAFLDTATHSIEGVFHNKYGYIIGGDAASSTPTNAFRRFDELLTSYTNQSLPTTARRYPAGGSCNGTLMMAAGQAAGPTAVATVEEYSDATNSWQVKGSITQARSQLSGGNKNFNNSMYVVGGNNLTSDLATVDEYRNFNWFTFVGVRQSPTLPTSVLLAAGAAAVASTVAAQIRTDGDNWKSVTANDATTILRQGETLINKFRETGLVYSSGGFNSSTVQATNFQFNDSQNVWITKGNMTTARGVGGGWSLQGVGYAIAGVAPSFPATTSVDKYNDLTDVSTSAAAVPTASAYLQGFTADGFGFVNGGSPDAGPTILSVNQKYDPTVNSWTTVTSMNIVKFGAFGFKLGGGGFASGGRVGTNTDTTDSEYYNNQLNTWVTKGSLATAKMTGGSTAGYGLNGYGYAACGQISTSGTANHQKYDIQADTWTNKTSAITSRVSPGSNVAGGYGFTYGGGAALTVNERYNDTQDSWLSMTALPVGTSNQQSINAGSYRNYDVRIGLPAYIAGIGGGTWTYQTSLLTSSTEVEVVEVGGAMLARNGTSITEYDYLFNTSRTVFTYGSNRSYPHVWGLNGIMYCSGGATGGSGTDTGVGDKFDLVTKTSLTIATSPNANGGGAGSGLNGYGYRHNGIQTSVTANITFFERYDPVANSFTSRTNSATPGAFLSDAVMQGFIYSPCGGGSGGSNGNYKYDDAADSWLTLTVVPFTGAAVSLGYFDAANTYNISLNTNHYQYNATTNAFKAEPVAPWATNGAYNSWHGNTRNGTFLATDGTTAWNISEFKTSLASIILGMTLEVK